MSPAPCLTLFVAPQIPCSCGTRSGQYVVPTSLSPSLRQLQTNRRPRSCPARVTVRAAAQPPRPRDGQRGPAHAQSKLANSESVYEQVIAVLPLSTVFRELLGDEALKPASSPGAYRVVCPFHDDRNPSLELSDEKKVWHCFGCGAGGNLFTFEKLSRNLELVPDALASLAKRYPVVAKIVANSGRSRGRLRGKLDETPPGSSLELSPQALFRAPAMPEARQWRKPMEERKLVHGVLSAAQEYFIAEFSRAAEAQAYLEKRGFSEQTIATFGFGFAPDADRRMRGCLNAMAARGFDQKTCILAGIAKEDRQGRVYDTFRNRVMLPIRDEDGRVISFAGRLLEESETAPKYLNGPSSPVFQKKEVIFGSDLVKASENSTATLEYGMVVIVEGYMDVVALHDKGAGRVACVAAMGTAVSKEQLLAARALLGDVVDGKLIVNLDGDDAGMAAAERLCNNVLCGLGEANCVYIAQPPSHVKDIGEYFEVGGTDVSAESYENYLEKVALPWIEWQVLRLMQGVLDSRSSIMSAAQVAQAAELGARNDGDDDDDGSWREVASDKTGVSQTAFLSEQMRRETLLLLDSMAGDADDNADNGKEDSEVDRPGADSTNDSSVHIGDSAAATISAATERQKRRAESLARVTKIDKRSGDGAGGADQDSIAGCPTQVLEKIGLFVAKALRTSPGVNFPWLVHRWADVLSDGETRRVPKLYDAIMSRIDRHSSKLHDSSPAYMIDWLPPAPWVVDELPKKKRASMRATMGREEDGKKQLPVSVFFSDKRNRALSQERQKKQERVIMRRIEQKQSPYSKGMRSNPRAAAEEIILRTLVWATDDDRLEGLEALVGVMISMEEAGLVPFWTSHSRSSLFQYLVDLDRELTVEEIAAECEDQDWWEMEIELLFLPIEAFGDEELTTLRKVELDMPVETVVHTAASVEEMAKTVATSRAVDHLGDFMEAKLGADGEMNASRVKELVDAVSGFAYLSAEERVREAENAEKLDKELQRQNALRLIEERLLRGEISDLPNADAPPA